MLCTRPISQIQAWLRETRRLCVAYAYCTIEIFLSIMGWKENSNTGCFNTIECFTVYITLCFVERLLWCFPGPYMYSYSMWQCQGSRIHLWDISRTCTCTLLSSSLGGWALQWSLSLPFWSSCCKLQTEHLCLHERNLTFIPKHKYIVNTSACLDSNCNNTQDHWCAPVIPITSQTESSSS